MESGHRRAAFYERHGFSCFFMQSFHRNRQRHCPHAHRKASAMRHMLRALFIFLIVIPLAAADSGVLIPGDRNTPDPNVLSLEEMALNIGIDNGTARISVREIFANHTNRNLEGTYSFALPIRAVLSDFAVWDDLT